MNNRNLIKKSLINAGLAALYVFALTFLMSSNKVTPKGAPEYLIGMGMLLIFVISATVMGYLVLGKPILMYLDGAKKEAVKLFYLTLSWLVVIAAIIFSILAIL